MNKNLLMLILFTGSLIMTTTVTAKDYKKTGVINTINYNKYDIKINQIAYKLSNTVKTYGIGKNKYLAYKELVPSLAIEFKYSSRGSIKTISEIWLLDIDTINNPLAK